MDEFFLTILALFVGAAYWKMAALRHRLDGVERRVEQSDSAFAALRRRLDLSPPPSRQAPPAEADEAPPSPAPETPAAPETPVPPSPTAPPPSFVEPPPPASEPAAASAPAYAAAIRGFEERLASRWLLWVGALALALGGAFLVKYAIDEGWIGPAVRVSFGFVFGCALAVAGEWLRQRPLQRAVAAIRPDYLPPALTASGLFIAFASVYAAFALYHLIGPLFAFLLMAALSVAAVFLSLLQGPFTALLGIIGGFVTPLLVPSEHPMAWGLFPYLLLLAASALAIVRLTAAAWVGWAALAGALAWPAIWLAAFWHPGDAGPVGTYLLALCALYLFVSPIEGREPAAGFMAFLQEADSAAIAGWGAAIGAAVLLFGLLRMDSYGNVSLLAVGGFSALSFVAGRRLAEFEAMPLLAEVLVLAGVAAWHLPSIITATSPIFPLLVVAGPAVPPGLHLFLVTAAAFAALFGIGAFLLMWRARQPQLWAAASATTPLLLLLVCYWRIEAFGIDLRWSATALALAAIEVAAAARVRRSEAPTMTLPLAIYAAAAVAAISLGATMALKEAWLTVALALQLPALAWIGLRLRIDSLRPVALALSAIVLVRLGLNYEILDYPLGGVPGHNWLIYVYGLPAAAFLVAANWFRRSRDDYLVAILELGAIAFGALLATLEIHNLVTGPLTAPRSGLLETSLQSLAWLAIAVGLSLPGRWSRRRTAIWARRVLAGLATGQVILWHLAIDNPLWSGDPVGGVPVFNLLLLAYGAPAALIAIYLYCDRLGGKFIAAGGALALVLVFAELTLEVRRSFQGGLISLGRVTSDGEWYCYSAVWLAYAGALLGLGIWSGSRALRHASLAVLMLATGKAFLLDMAGLTGLYRVASFFGLGLSMIAIGYFYQRFVFAPAPGRGRGAPA